LGLAEVWGHL